MLQKHWHWQLSSFLFFEISFIHSSNYNNKKSKITGEADVYVSKRGGEPFKVLTYANGSGAAFGELALMYNAPRAATVRASTNVKVWSLDQSVFRSIVVGSAARRMDQQIEFLRKVKGKCWKYWNLILLYSSY